MTRRDFGLLVLILLLGAGFTIANRARRCLLEGDVQLDGLEFLQGPLHTFSETGEAPLPSGSLLTVEAGRGDVEVMTWSEPRVRIEVKKQIHHEREAEAERIASQLKLEIVPGPDGVLARAAGSRATGLKTGLTVMVPAESRLHVITDDGAVIVHRVAKDVMVKTAHGDVEVSEAGGRVEVVNSDGSIDLRRVRGPAALRTAHGDIRVSDLEGAIEVTSADGDVSLSRVGGGILVTGAHGDIEVSEARAGVNITTANSEVAVSDVTGTVDVVNQHGSVKVERARGDVRLNVPHCEVVVRDLQGALTAKVQSDSLRAEQVKGPVKIQTSASEVTLTDVSGPIVVAGSHTPVEIVRPGDDVEVSTTNQEIRLASPAGSGFRLDARAEQGEVESDLEDLHVPGDRPSHFAGVFGDGRHRYRLATSHSTISVVSSLPRSSDDEDDSER